MPFVTISRRDVAMTTVLYQSNVKDNGNELINNVEFRNKTQILIICIWVTLKCYLCIFPFCLSVLQYEVFLRIRQLPGIGFVWKKSAIVVGSTVVKRYSQSTAYGLILLHGQQCL